MLERRRWRQPPLTRPALTLALASTFVLHALFVLGLWYEMRPGVQPAEVVPVQIDRALVVRLLDASRPSPAAPPPAPLTPPGLPPPRQAVSAPPLARPAPHQQPHHDARVVQDQPPATTPTPPTAPPSATGLFAKDGSVRLPPTTTAAAAAASTQAPPAEPADDRRVMQHDSNHMHYKATRFEKYFPPPNETAGGAVGRHVGDAIKAIAKSVCAPDKHSAASAMLCGVPPPPPSPKDGDERLSLPPPPLAGDPHPAKTPSLASCMAEYRATKPLSYGCPLDTPDLAFKEEMRECIDLYRAGKRLKTWCPADTPKRAAAEAAMPAVPSSAGSR